MSNTKNVTVDSLPDAHLKQALILISIEIIKEHPAQLRPDNINEYKSDIEDMELLVSEPMQWTSASDHLTILNAIGSFYDTQGLYKVAKRWREESVSVSKNYFGNLDIDVGRSLLSLGFVHEQLGHFEEAETCYLDATDIYLVFYGRFHVETGRVWLSLASLYCDFGHYQEAEQICSGALDIAREHYLDEDITVFAFMTLLGTIYKEQGQHQEAERFYLEVLQLERQSDTGELLSIATTLESIAVLYMEQKRYQEAEPLLEECLERRRSLQGEEHPATISTLRNWAKLQEFKGDGTTIEASLKEALRKAREMFGEQHPQVEKSLTDLACLYLKQGRCEEGLNLIKKAVEIARNVYDAQHPSLALSLKNLAASYEVIEQYQEAESLLLEALSIQQALWGNTSSEVASTHHHLAVLCRKQERYEEAEVHCQQMIEGFQACSSRQNIDLADPLLNMAQIYYFQNRFDEAEPLFRDVVEIMRKTGRDRVREFATALFYLADCYWAHERYDETEGLYRDALNILEQQEGPPPSESIVCLLRLALIYKYQGQKAKEIGIHLRLLMMQQASEVEDGLVDLVSTHCRLALLYKDQGCFEEAEEHFKQMYKAAQDESRGVDKRLPVLLLPMGEFYCEQDRFEDAANLISDGIAIMRRAEMDRGDDFAKSLYQLAQYYWVLERYEETEVLYKEAVECAEDAVGRMWHLAGLAQLYYRQGRTEEAEEADLRASLINQQQHLGERSMEVAATHLRLAVMYKDQGRYEEAYAHFRETHEITQAYSWRDDERITACLIHISDFYFNQERFKEAEPIYIEVVEIMRERGWDKEWEFTKILFNLGECYWGLECPENAEDLYKEALDILEEKGESFPGEKGAYYSNLDRVYAYRIEQSKREKGIVQCLQDEEYEKLIAKRKEMSLRADLAVQRAWTGHRSIEFAATLCELAAYYKNQKNFEEAEALFQQMYEIVQAYSYRDDEIVPYNLCRSIVEYLKQERLETGETVYIGLIETLRQKGRGKDYGVAMLLYALAESYWECERYDETEGLYKEHVAILEAEEKPFPGMKILSLSRLKELYQQQGRANEAEAIDQQLVRARTPLLSPSIMDDNGG